MGQIGAQLKTIKTKKRKDKKNEEDVFLSMFCAKCKIKYHLRYFPLDTIQEFFLFPKNHFTNSFPLLPKLMVSYHAIDGYVEVMNFAVQKKP